MAQKTIMRVNPPSRKAKPVPDVSQIQTSGQRGFTLVSLLIVVVATGALLALYVERQMERARLDRGEQIGQALKTLGHGFERYLREHRVALAAEVPRIPGVTNPLAPTAEALIRIMKINGVASTPPLVEKASYRFLVTYPSGCSATQKLHSPRCRPAALAYIDKPLKRGKEVDYVAVAQAVRVMNGRGGYARPDSAWQFTFPDSVTAPVPIPVVNPTRLAGVLAWRAEVTTSRPEYVQLDGGNRMTGPLRLDGRGKDHDLIGSKNIAASGTLLAKQAAVRENLSIKNRLTVRGVPSARPGVTISKDAHVKGDLTTKYITRGDTLYFPGAAVHGSLCHTPFALTTNADGRLLQCDNSRWKALDIASQVHSIFAQPPSASDILRTFTFYLGNYVYCRVPYDRTIYRAKYDFEKKSWVAWGSAGQETLNILCYGKLPS